MKCVYSYEAVLLVISVLVSPIIGAHVNCSDQGEPDTDTTKILLDTNRYNSLLPSPWNSSTWMMSSNFSEDCRPAVEVCSNTSQDNILFSPFINTTMISEFGILVDFMEGLCDDPPCSTNFSISVYPTSTENIAESRDIGNYINIEAVVKNNALVTFNSPSGGFYLAFRATQACVVISRVRVFYTVCQAVNRVIIYPATNSGQSATGMCVQNASSTSPLPNMECRYNSSFTPVDVCQCDVGHGLINGNSCIACPQNNYKSEPGNTQCLSCPANSNTDATASSECQCNRGYVRPNSTIVSADCSMCNTSYYRNSGTRNCEVCPAFSDRTVGANETYCLCLDNRVTSYAEEKTSGRPCDGCRTNFFISRNQCIGCPDNSVSNYPNDTECQCSDNYRRRHLTVTDVCLPIIGFDRNSITVNEGLMKNISLRLSTHLQSQSLGTVNISQSPMNSGLSLYNDTLKISSATSLRDLIVQVVSMDNNIALEGTKTFELMLTEDGTQPLVVGGNTSIREFYNRTIISLQDDDSVNVGFTVSTITYKGFMTTIFIQRLQPIASKLNLTIEGPSDIELRSRTVVFDEDMINLNTTMSVSFQVMEGITGQRRLTLTQSGHIGSVIIGGGSTHKTITINIDQTRQAPLSEEAIIGIAVAVAGVAVLLLLAVVICVCICRLRVNRQGFYHTHEDKSEPPTMLRYSASLRSISSQTVIPANEGKSVPKENEFYV